MEKVAAERRERFNQMWERYHNGGLKDLPAEVYFDVGYLMGWIVDLEHQMKTRNVVPHFGKKLVEGDDDNIPFCPG